MATSPSPSQSRSVQQTAQLSPQAGPSSSTLAASPSTSGAQQPVFGPQVWQEQRKQWRKPSADAKPPKGDPVIPSTAMYDDLLLSNEYFDESIPLPEMVEFLVDAWIQDGLYD